jgi:hypothetical protein
MDDALLILRKWQQEKNPVFASLSSNGKSVGTIFGRVQGISESWIVIDDRGRSRSGKSRSELKLFINEVLSFRYEDSRYVPPDSPAAELAKQYDGFLFIELDWCECSIWALPVEELST